MQPGVLTKNRPEVEPGVAGLTGEVKGETALVDSSSKGLALKGTRKWWKVGVKVELVAEAG